MLGGPGSEYIAAKGTLESALQSLTGFLTHYELKIGNSPYDVVIEANFYNDIYNFGTYSGYGFESQLDNLVTAISVSHTKSDVICHGVANGSITLTISGGADPFTFLWSDGATTQNRTALPAGTYSVQITDSLGTVTNYTGIVISEPANAISIDSTKQNVLCNGAENGIINITASGGTPGYTYSWSHGPTTQNVSGLAPGSYSVTVTDSVGCNNTFNFTITEPDSIAIEATVDGNNVTVAVTGGTAPFSYLWSNGATTQNLTDVVPGEYEVQVTDANGCIAFASVTVASYRFFFSDNPIILELTAEDPETKPNLSFICEVWVERTYLSGVYTKIITLEQPADSAAHTVFNVQTALDAYVEPHLPTVYQSTVTRADNIFKRYYLKYTEKFGEPPAEATYTQVNVNFVVLGGLSEEEYAANTFFASFQDTQKPFFTWTPIEKKDLQAVFKEQPEYLYFMVNSFAVSSFKAKVKIYYTDGTDGTSTFHTQSDVHRYELFLIPAGHNQLDLASYNTDKTVKAWEVFVTDSSDNLISETRKYRLNTDYFPYKRFLLYLNSLGGFDTLCISGKASMAMDTDEVIAERILPYNHGVSDPDFEVLEKVGSRQLKVSTGYKSKEYMDRLQDFLISPAVYLLLNDRHIPVKVRTRNSEIFDEESTINKIDVTLELPAIKHFTPKL
jgi:hypothetical protein